MLLCLFRVQDLHLLANWHEMFVQRNTYFNCEVVKATRVLYMMLLKLHINYFCVTCWNHFATELTSIFIFVTENFPLLCMISNLSFAIIVVDVC